MQKPAMLTIFLLVIFVILPVLILLVLFVLLQNSGQQVDLEIFTLLYSDINFSIVLLGSLGLGTILGAGLLTLNIIHVRLENQVLRKDNIQLTKELENLGNFSIGEFSNGIAVENNEFNGA